MNWEKDFDLYVSKYCVKHKIDRETALKHALIKEVEQYYKSAEKGKMGVLEVKAGCGGAEIGGDCK